MTVCVLVVMYYRYTDLEMANGAKLKTTLSSQPGPGGWYAVFTTKTIMLIMESQVAKY